MNHKAQTPSRISDYFLSWDRLSFRFLVFGGLALVWILQGRVWDRPWLDLILGELRGLMPWAFLAPMVLALDQRIRHDAWFRFLAAHSVAAVLIFIPYWVMQRGVDLVWTLCISGLDAKGSWLGVWMPTKQNLLGSFLNVPIMYFLILLGAAAMKHARAHREEEIQAGRLVGQLAEARLVLLQRQLHPHFLFNALQAISTLLHRDPQTADRLLVRLSDLLRAMLEQASRQTLELRVELELTRKYVEIEQVRFGDRLEVQWSVDETLLNQSVPSLIVLPLVENAIRHGLSPKIGTGSLKIVAATEEGKLVLKVEDDGLGAVLPLRLGVGIGNTQERLEALYGGHARLDIETGAKDGFRIRIQLPLQQEGS